MVSLRYRSPAGHERHGSEIHSGSPYLSAGPGKSKHPAGRVRDYSLWGCPAHTLGVSLRGAQRRSNLNAERRRLPGCARHDRMGRPTPRNSAAHPASGGYPRLAPVHLWAHVRVSGRIRTKAGFPHARSGRVGEIYRFGPIAEEQEEKPFCGQHAGALPAREGGGRVF
jgi:hypothetical protein